jgi:ferredoxin
VAEKSGMLRVIEETGAELAEFTKTLEVTGKGVFKRFELARPYMEADRLINLAKLKTHEMMTMTCAVKNLFGAVVGTAKAAWHLKAGADRELFARMLLEIYLLRRPDLNIVDAVTAMEGNGPGSGDPREVGLLIGGTNPVSVDMIVAEIVGIPPRRLHVERMAERLGLDGSDRGQVGTVGAPLAEVKVHGFRLPHISDVQFGLPGFLKNRLRHHMTSRPVPFPGGCKLCGICADACPPGAISIKNGRLSIDYHKCIRCFCCRELCPDGALDVKDGALIKYIRRFV